MSEIMQFRRTLLILPLYCLSLILSGCVLPKQASIDIEMDDLLKGNVTVHYRGLTSQHKDPGKRLEEQQEFNGGGYQGFARMVQDAYCLQTMEVELENKTDTSCDGWLKGSTDDVVPMFATMGFDVTCDGNIFTFVHRAGHRAGETVEPEPHRVLSVSYRGIIKETNATTHEPGQGIMEWNGKGLMGTSVRFVVEVKREISDLPGQHERMMDLVGPVRLTGITAEMAGVKPTASGKIAWFVDRHLERAVREAAGKLRGVLLISDCEKLIFLKASNRDIRFLSGIEQCSSLTSVDLSHNKIGFLTPLTELKALRTLALRENSLKSLIPLTSITSLVSLDLSRNNISERDLGTLSLLSGLENLDLANIFQVKNFSFLTTMKQLRTLNLSGSNIDDISGLGQAKELRALNLSYTRIHGKTASLAAMKKLESLDLAYSSLSDLSFLSFCTGLKNLDLSGLQIEDPGAVASLDGLIRLNLAHNQISDLKKLTGLNTLITLSLASNRLKDVSPLGDLKRLEEIDLSDNQIVSLESLAKLHNLVSLKVANNRVDDVIPISRLYKLNILDLAGNRVRSIRPLVDNISLVAGDILFLDDNPLDDDDRADIQELEKRMVRVRHTLDAPDGFDW